MLLELFSLIFLFSMIFERLLFSSFFKGVFLEIAKALRLIHQKGIMHRCIRTNHIFLVNSDNEDYDDLKNSVKLGGFNFAIYIRDNKSEPLDTIFYTAPEIIKNFE